MVNHSPIFLFEIENYLSLLCVKPILKQGGVEKMAQVASLMVRLQADISNYESNMQRATNTVQRLQTQLNGISGVLSTVSDGLKNVGRSITKYITTPILGAMGVGVKFNSDMENAITSFTTLLRSAEKAQNIILNLQGMASSTPFGLGDLQKGATTLLSFGQSVESILPTLRMLGDVALGNKEKFDSLTLAFAQVQSAGKLSGQDLLQMVNAGFNPLQQIAERTGKSMAELKDEMSKGAITADMVTQAFIDATSKGGRFYKGMESASKTLSGMFSTLKDNTMELFGELSKPAFDWLKEKIQGAIGVIERIKNAISSLDDATKKKITTILLLVAAIGPAVVAISMLVGAIAGLTAVMGFLAANPVVLTITGIIIAIMALIGILAYLYKTNESVRNAIISAWNSIKSFFQNLVKFISQFKDVIVANFQNTWDSIVVTLKGFVQVIGDVFGLIGALLNGDWKGMWEYAKSILKTVFSTMVVTGINFADSFLAIFQKLSSLLLDGIFAKIVNGFEGLVNSVLKGYNWVAERIGFKTIGYLDIDIEKYKPSALTQRYRNELAKVANYFRGGEKTKLPSFNLSGINFKGLNLNLDKINKTTESLNLDDFMLNVADSAKLAKDGVDKLADSVKNLVQSIRQQTDAFKNSLAIFDKFERKTISPERLLNRLKAQVKAMTDWTNALSTLQTRGVSEAFLNELRMMGPQQVDYIRALAQMSDEQLAQYQALYGQKYNIAQREAERAVATEQKINTYIDKKIDIHITGNTISSQNDAAKLANEIIRELKLRGI